MRTTVLAGALLVAGWAGCANVSVPPPEPDPLDRMDPVLTIQVVDETGAPALRSFVRVSECCRTERGPCGRVPAVDGQAKLDVCPGPDGIIHVTLTPDPRKYRVAPVREYEVRGDTSITLTVTRHESALGHLKPSAS